MKINIYNLDRKILKELWEAFGERPIWRVEPNDSDCVDVTLRDVELITHVARVEFCFKSSSVNVDCAEFERIEII